MKAQIIRTIKEKSLLKQQIYDLTAVAFAKMKVIISELVADYNDSLKGEDKRVMLEYTDGGDFTIKLKVASDVLVFTMHTNVFEFPNTHEVWNNIEYKNNPELTYSGIISIYNFLSDSFKYDRKEDEGYLFGRIFINKENTFFTDGLRELGFIYPKFGQNEANEKNFKSLIESSIAFALKFDLFVPNFEDVYTMLVDDVQETILKAKMKTGKRLGFNYKLQDENEK